MARLVGASADRLSDHFVHYLFDEYQGSRHVRRVAAWVGLIILGIARVADTDWRIPRNRQLRFQYKGRSFKAKYNHRIGARGGIEIVEVLAGRGAPDGERIASISTLEEAEQFYRTAARLFRRISPPAKQN